MGIKSVRNLKVRGKSIKDRITGWYHLPTSIYIYQTRTLFLVKQDYGKKLKRTNPKQLKRRIGIRQKSLYLYSLLFQPRITPNVTIILTYGYNAFTTKENRKLGFLHSISLLKDIENEPCN